MNWPRAASLLVVSAMVLGIAGGASAQLQLGGMNVSGDMEGGVRFFVDEPSQQRRGKLEEYRDLSQGLFLDHLQLRIFRPDESYSADVFGTKWGLTDQEFALSARRLGLWEVGFDWNQTPHIFSTTARSFYGGLTSGSNVFTLPTPRPALASYNAAPRIDEISTRWDTAHLFFRLTPTPDLEFRAEYTRIKKDGERPFSMAFGSPGNNFAEIVEPIDQTVHDFRLTATWAPENWQIQFGYIFSMFENAFKSVIADNPCFGQPQCGADATGAQPAGQTALAPNNTAHTFSLAGAVNLPLKTRISTNVSYSLRLQDASFLPFTINPAAADSLTLPARSLDGIVGITNVNFNVTSRPLPQPLTLTLKYRLFDYNDMTDKLVFPGDVVNDRVSGLVTTPLIFNRYSYTRQSVDADGRWRFGQPLAATVGGGWERWDRNRLREVPTSNEAFAKLAVDATPTDWLLARLTYRPSFRRIDSYNTTSPATAGSPDTLTSTSVALGQSFLLRKFDEADRDRQRVDLLVQLTPRETFTTTLNGGWKYDNYLHSALGLQQATEFSAGIDVAWTPVERLSLSAGYVHEVIFQKQESRSRPVAGTTVFDDPSFDWLTDNNDIVDTAHLGVSFSIIPHVLDWTAGGSFSLATGSVETRNPVAPALLAGCTPSPAACAVTASAKRMPAFEDNLFRLDTSLRYHLSKVWTARLGYAFESFTKHDWRTDTLNPFMGLSSIWLGNDSRNYTAHILFVTLRAQF